MYSSVYLQNLTVNQLVVGSIPTAGANIELDTNVLLDQI
jgi:hypothetical protein